MSIHAVSAAFRQDCPSPTCKLVLLALANYADANGQCFPTANLIASETGLSPRAVKAALGSLAEAGIIERTERRRKNGTQTSSIYTLIFQSERAAPCDDRVQQAHPDRVQITSAQSAGAAPLTTLEPSLEPSLKTRDAIAEQIWQLQPVTGGKRKATRPDVREALEAVVKRGGRPEDVLAALTAYYRLPDCRKDEGRFASGAVVMMHKDRWRDFLPSAAPAANDSGPVDPKVTARRLRHWRDTGSWDAAWGQKPDAPANDSPAPAQRGAAA
jgi:DNA-binding transcriptional ArsR family regulator